MKPWLAFPVAALALVATACSGGSSAGPAASPASSTGSAPSASPSASPSDPLSGTWETDVLPTETWVTTLRGAGATAADTVRFRSELAAAGAKHRYLIRILDGHWVELEQHDNGTPSVGWDGTYTLSGDHVSAQETAAGGCHVTYQITLSGDTLSLRVVSDLPESPPRCGHVDSWYQRSIYETAPFHRTT
jgi:hypothetical protein